MAVIKKIDEGKTNLKDLHQVFLLEEEALEKRRARLFPNGNTENEVATTSIFLASLSSVKEYREELLTTIGINKIRTRNVKLHVYTEICNESKEDRPDGLIVITSGKNTPIIEWAAFVEVKVAENEIDEKQIGNYVEFAREKGINNIITISNQLVTTPMDSPVKTKKRSFNLYHWSWAYLRVAALKLIKEGNIEDEDHVYILTELRRYLDAHKNLRNFTSMGKEWKDSVNKIHSVPINKNIDSIIVNNIVSAYKQEEKDISLQLTDSTECYVELVAKQDRSDDLAGMLQKHRVITSSFYVDRSKKSKFSIDVDFLRQSVRCYCQILAAEKGKSQAQTTKLLKLLDSSGATEDIFIKAFYSRNKAKEHGVSLRVLNDEKDKAKPYSILDKSFGEEVKHFEIETRDILGKSEFQSAKKFIEKTENIAARFLNQVMENIH